MRASGTHAHLRKVHQAACAGAYAECCASPQRLSSPLLGLQESQNQAEVDYVLDEDAVNAAMQRELQARSPSSQVQVGPRLCCSFYAKV